MNDARQPVIVIGMHRSGTSLVTKLLHDLGLNMGWRRESNEEAWLFHKLNVWILHQAGGSWECPEAIAHVLDCPDVRRTVVDYLRFVIESPQAISFLGPLGFVRHRSVTDISAHWGWKDPRNTFTLPLWLDLFPDAKIIHVYRHGVDVAQSLKKRHEWGCDRLAQRFALTKPLYWFRQRKTPLMPSGRCGTLEGGFSLWEQYTVQSRVHVQALGARAIDIKYEEFLANPQPFLRTLAVFGGLDVSDATIDRVVGSVRRERAYAYKGKPELEAFAAANAERLAVFGYQS